MKGRIVGSQIFKAGAPRATPAAEGRRTQPQGESLTVASLPPERAEPVAYMMDRIKNKQPLDGPSALELNVAVQEVLEAAKLSIKTGRAITLPLE